MFYIRPLAHISTYHIFKPEDIKNKPCKIKKKIISNIYNLCVICRADDLVEKVHKNRKTKREARLRSLMDLAINELFENGKWLVHLGHAGQDFNPFDVLR